MSAARKNVGALGVSASTFTPGAFVGHDGSLVSGQDCNRREFLGQVGRGAVIAGVMAAGLGDGIADGYAQPLRPMQPGRFNTALGKVWIVRSGKCVQDGKHHAPTIASMVEAGVKACSGKDTAKDAWLSFVSPKDVIGLNVNPISTRIIPTSLEATEAVIDGLLAAGIPGKNIVIFDLRHDQLAQAGYEALATKKGVRCEGTEGGNNEWAGYDREAPYKPSAEASRTPDTAYFASIVTKGLTKIINLPVMKHHAIAGITVCLKGLSFGIVSDRPRYHPSKCHPMVAETVGNPHIKDKLVLNIVDATKALYHTGPTPRSTRFVWEEKAMLFATDPVACDQVALELIDKKRDAEGLSPTVDRAIHVQGCADAGLGKTTDLQRMTIDLDAPAGQGAEQGEF